MKEGAPRDTQPRTLKPRVILRRRPKQKHHPRLTPASNLALRKHIKHSDRPRNKAKGRKEPDDIPVEMERDDRGREDAGLGKDGDDGVVGDAAVEHGQADERAGEFGGGVGDGGPQVVKEVAVGRRGLAAGRGVIAGGGALGVVVAAVMSAHCGRGCVDVRPRWIGKAGRSTLLHNSVNNARKCHKFA
jgi:hypothetical protein